MSVTGAIRFLVGASLVAAGGSLVAPLATKLAAVAAATSRDEGRPVAPGAGAASMQAAPAPSATLPTAVVRGPDPSQEPGESPLPADPWAAASDAATPDSAGGLQLDRCPPPPPTPLPPPPQELVHAGPALGPAYRSTLQVPPPQLLDAIGPPPAASWAAPPLSAGAPSQGSASREITVPATYRVRDGDDLGTIAGRFYGDTAAAPAIWAANRETVPNPDLLPIGAELRMPPSWAVNGLRRPVAGAIEPVSYARPVAPPPGRGPGAMPQPEPWLVPAAGSVRVGPGETLGSLARRLYGDSALADEIFAANRDRLRSPELVVAGMELRLPRPVTGPRP